MNFRLVILVLFLLFRFYHLGVRPPHHDEAVNGWFVDGIFQNGFYRYDPQNYHGPIHFYILTFFEILFGRSIEVLRASTVILGGLVAFTPFLFKKYISDRGAWIAAFFLAVSPAMVFYSRYAIHEMGFMLACILFLYFWLKVRKESFTYKNILGLAGTLALMACFKENFILFVACLFIGEGVLYFVNRFFPNRLKEEPLIAFKDKKKAAIGLGSILCIALAIIFLVFSAFGRDENGIKNFFQAFAFWSETGSKGNGHQKPIYYWLKLLFELEWFAFFGLILSPLALKKISSELRLIIIVTVGLLCAYSIVNYKTPWCVMSFYFGFIFFASFWVSKWMDQKNRKGILTCFLVVGFGFSAYQSYDVAYVNVDAEDHLYIYGQTYRDLMVPMKEITDQAKANPELLKSMRIQIISQFTWPLPWIFGEFKQVGYFGEQNAPAVLDGDYIIIDKVIESKYAPNIKGNYSRNEVRSRQWASPMVIYTKQK